MNLTSHLSFQSTRKTRSPSVPGTFQTILRYLVLSQMQMSEKVIICVKPLSLYDLSVLTLLSDQFEFFDKLK